MSDCQVGDLAVFVGGKRCGGNHSRSNVIKHGDTRYRRVTGIRQGPFSGCKAPFALILEGHQSGIIGTCPSTWRKVRPDERDQCEPEFVTLIKRAKRTVTA